MHGSSLHHILWFVDLQTTDYVVLVKSQTHYTILLFIVVQERKTLNPRVTKMTDCLQVERTTIIIIVYDETNAVEYSNVGGYIKGHICIPFSTSIKYT